MRVYNVPASAPFLRTVIAALVDGRLIDGFDARAHPERLVDVTLYLPTRRAVRMARDIFLDVLDTDAVLLPRIVALGNVDPDDLSLADDGQFGDTFDIPPELPDLERRLTLARLVATWARQLKPDSTTAAPLVAGGPASTLALAGDLARLIDDMATRGVDWQSLDGLVPDQLDRYWQLTLDFLKIAREYWPTHLQAIGMIESVERRDRLIEAEASRLRARPRGPVIAAGSTGSMPATAKFLHAIVQMPHGAVVLPGLDTDLDEKTWHSIGGSEKQDGDSLPPSPGHPQFALHALLARFGISRDDVEQLTAPLPHGREILVSEAMRPAHATAQWHRRLAEPDRVKRIVAATNNLAVVETANPEMEALAIAVAMREAYEMKRTATLVTPDRALARRVTAALGRWKLPFNESGGETLIHSPAGVFARLAAATVAGQWEPATLLALLKHPMLGLDEETVRRTTAIADLELALLRGTRPPAGGARLASEFALFRDQLAKLRRGEPSTLHRSELRTRLDDTRLDAVESLIIRLRAALHPLESFSLAQTHDVKDLADRHRATLTLLSRDDAGVITAFAGADGTALAKALDDLIGQNATGFAVTLADYPDVFETAFATIEVRRPAMADAPLQIFGLLEARLTHSDRVILGGLVDGVWPPSPRVDPWLSRPMRLALGLDLPERRIGLSAHDFTQLLGTEEVILTHATRVGGAPAVASRLLHRLEAVMGERLWEEVKARGSFYRRHAATLDHPSTVTPAARPMPKPARTLRPLRMSVTEIEDWLRDPYSIYARRILGLTPLDPVDMALSVADRGSAIHNALGDYTTEFRRAPPGDPVAALTRIGLQHFKPLLDHPEARALWWPRFLRIADWFAGWDAERRLHLSDIDAEIYGELSIPLGDNRAFILSARADRIEHRTDRTFALVDYKTGQPPTSKQVRLGLSPQLTLEGAILHEGGFKTIANGASIGELLYVRLSGNNPPGEPKTLELKVDREPPQSPDEAAREARRELEKLVRRYDSDNEPYRSVVLSMWSNRYGVYDNLARIKEWAADSGTVDDEP